LVSVAKKNEGVDFIDFDFCKQKQQITGTAIEIIKN
jgi:hypothetical protein